MPYAAVPWYLAAKFQEAPPGHYYLLYLPFWGEDWKAIKEGKQEVLKKLGAIPNYAREVMSALAERQRAIGKAVGAEVIEAISTSPFTTGLGWEHPNENGFAFLHPYGLPYLAASGVKGVLRDAARELADGSDVNTCGWTKDAVNILFGPPMREEGTKLEDIHRGALRFFDVIPEITNGGMGVDIMNPHYGDYYQGKATPHDAGSPVPIFFLVVPPSSKFTFVVDCPLEHRLLEDLRGKWRVMIRAAFEHAFEWLGFGAKTAVGYGAMATEEMRRARGYEPGQTGPKGAAARHSSQTRIERTETTWKAAILRYDPSRDEISAEFEKKRTSGLKGERARQVFDALGEKAGQLRKRKELKDIAVHVRIEGNSIELLRLAERL